MRRIARGLAVAILLGAIGAVSAGLAQGSLQLVFRVPDGSPIRSSPVIDLAKNAIYFGADDGSLYAIPLISSEQPRRAKWVFSPDPDPAKRRPMRTPPVIDEARNRIYIGADDGKLYAVDRDTGQPVEGFNPEPRSAPIRVPPTLDQPRSVLYVGADDQQVLAINAGDGSRAGQTNPTFNAAKGAIRTAPIVDFVKSRIYFGSDDGILYALDREDFTGPIKVEIGSPIRGSPLLDILVTEALIYFGADNGVFYAIDREGQELYRFETFGPVRTKAAVDPVKNAVYFVSDDGRLYALFRSDEKDSKGTIKGRERGKQKFAIAIVTDNNPNPFDGDLPRSSPVVDRRLGATGTGTIIVGSVDGRLYGISPDSGRSQFILAVPGAGTDPRAAIRTTPALYVSGPSASIDIYIGADDGGLYVTRRP